MAWNTSSVVSRAIRTRGLLIRMRLFVGPIAAVGILALVGCGKSTPSTAPRPLPAASKPSTKPLPPEYRILAENLGLEIKPSPDQFRDNKGTTQIIAEGHESIMALRNIESSDRDIAYVAEQAQGAFSEAIKRMERINSLPKPPGAGELFVSSFIDGFFGNVFGGYARGQEAEGKQAAIITEAEAMLAAIEKADAAHQLLPKIAEKYSATFCDSTDRIAVDCDESWGWFGPHDWCSFRNCGAALEDCTIVVQLTGASGEVRKNVHFVKAWPANTWLYARYSPGQEMLGRKSGRMTVSGIRQVDVTIYSPQFATLIKYVYEGVEKDRHIAAHCKDLTLKGRYQPFVGGMVWDTERGAYFTLDGVAVIPKCRVDLTFRRGSESKSFFWNFDYWKKGDEKWFGTSKGQLTFDPDSIEITVSFPDTNYKHERTLTVKK